MESHLGDESSCGPRLHQIRPPTLSSNPGVLRTHITDIRPRHTANKQTNKQTKTNIVHISIYDPVQLNETCLYILASMGSMGRMETASYTATGEVSTTGSLPALPWLPGELRLVTEGER